MHGLATNEPFLQKHLTALQAKLDVYEVILGKTKYLAGDVSTLSVLALMPTLLTCIHVTYIQEITLADLFHLPYGYVLTTAKGGYPDLLENEKRPNVAR